MLASNQGRGKYFEVGGGGQTSPGIQGNPYPKTENTPDMAHYFFGETQVHVQKEMNDTDSPKLGGGGRGTPSASKLWGKASVLELDLD